MFRDALQRRLLTQHSVDYVASLHRRASDWFARHELIEEAIRHALAAGDTGQAALLVEENIYPLLDREGDPGRLEKWIRLLPADVADNSVAVLLARAWVAGFRDRPAELPELLRGAEALLDEDTSRDEALREALRGTVDCLWSVFWFTRSEGERILASTESAIHRVPTRWRSARGDAEYMHACALAFAGRDQEALDFLAACRASATQADGVRIGMLLRAEARLHYFNLRNRDLTRTAGLLLTTAQTGQLARTGTGGHLFAGLASYVSNDLFDARDHFQAVLAARDHAGLASTLDSVIALALIGQALGDEDQAQAVLLEMATLLADLGTAGPLSLLHSCQARIALMRGDLDEAGRQLRMIRDDESVGYPSLVEVPEITLARWLLLQGMSSGLEEVAAIVDRLHSQAAGRGHALGVLRAELVQSLLAPGARRH